MIKLNLTVDNLKKTEYFLAVTLLGLIEGVISQKISIDEAEKVFFSPNLANNLETLGLTNEIIHAIWLGTELEDVESLLPDKLPDALLEIKSLLLNAISSYQFDLYNPLINEMSINIDSHCYQVISPFSDDEAPDRNIDL